MNGILFDRVHTLSSQYLLIKQLFPTSDSPILITFNRINVGLGRFLMSSFLFLLISFISIESFSDIFLRLLICFGANFKQLQRKIILQQFTIWFTRDQVNKEAILLCSHNIIQNKTHILNVMYLNPNYFCTRLYFNKFPKLWKVYSSWMVLILYWPSFKLYLPCTSSSILLLITLIRSCCFFWFWLSISELTP